MSRKHRDADHKPTGDKPTIRDQLAAAVRCHQAGEWAEAERRYREILAVDPGHADSLNLLGVMAQQFGHHEAAAALIGQAIGRCANDASYHYNLGLALKSQGKSEAAAASFARALVLRPDYAEALHNLGNLRRDAGRPDEAAAYYARALALRPDLPEIHNNLGGLHDEAGRHEAAVACFRRALAANPGFVPAHYNLGKSFAALGVLDEAAEAYRRALELQPGHIDAALGIGTVLTRQGETAAAIACLHRVVEVRPDHAVAHYNLALALEAAGDFASAIAAYRQAIALLPGYAEALNNLGVALQAEGRFEEAVCCYEQALKSRPEDAEIHNNLGTALQSLQRPTAALASYRRALERRPDYAGAEMNLATCQLLTGDLRRGFAGFRRRWDVPEAPIRMPDLDRPLWAGEDLGGRTILVHCEQGLGDSLQFIRYAPLLATRAARVLVLAPPALAGLFRASIPAIEIVETPPDAAAFDYHIPLLCLPRLFGTALADVPAAIPYLASDPAKTARWAALLAPHRNRRLVGLVWAGAPRPADRQANAVDRRRSLPLSALAPLSGVPDVQFVSLQKGPAASQAPAPSGFDLLDLTAGLQDFTDTAALIANLDLVISVDTSVAHLAGALGRPVWLLSRFDGCWRWLLDRDDSPWYPSLRLFRQPQPGDWPSVIVAVRRALKDWVAGP